MTRWRLTTAWFVLLATFTLRGAERPVLTPADLMRLEEFGDVSIAPDGHSVAFVRRRPIASARIYQQSGLYGNDRADIWLWSPENATPNNITRGAATGEGYFQPRWSPDGTRLAMLSVTPGDTTVHLVMWDKVTGRFSRLARRGVSLSQFPRPTSVCAWLGNDAVLVSLLPEGAESAHVMLDRRAAITAMREWPKAWAGTEVTASVMDSGVQAADSEWPREQLVIARYDGKIIPVASALTIREISTGPPGARSFAFLEQVARRYPGPDEPLLHMNVNRYGSVARYRVALADSDGRLLRTEGNEGEWVVPNTLKWSPSGNKFAFVGGGVDARGGDFAVFIGSATGVIERLPKTNELDPQQLVWVDDETVLCLAHDKGTKDGRRSSRKDWWLLRANRVPQNVTLTIATPPAELIPVLSGRFVFGAGDGDLWRLDPTSATWTNVTEDFTPTVTSMFGESDRLDQASINRRKIVFLTENGATTYHTLDTLTGQILPISSPSEFATLVSYQSDSDIAVFAAAENTGSRLTVIRDGSRDHIAETNQFLRDIAAGPVQCIDYRSLDGEDLKAWLILPPNYQANKRYPLVALVYAGAVAGSPSPPGWLGINNAHNLNPQLLAAHGYVVLVPSMPLPSAGTPTELGRPSDPYLELTKGVLPAVERVIQLGIADVSRLALIGHSFGGFSTYGLITQTNRFRAAVALAGLSDFLSLYGVIDARSRYEASPVINTFDHFLDMQSLAETGQLRMGSPPWKDIGRYIRNSPLFYVERVQTPLLIIHGDMDAVSITQGEEFFTALYRQGKRARMIRYWGEGHNLSSPANIVDMWNRIYEWLDEFVGVGAQSDNAGKD